MSTPTPPTPDAGPRPRGSTYRHAHWFLAAALAAILAGFWPSFFRPIGANDFGHTLHGITATLWVVALIAQSWLIAHGMRAWHRRVAVGALIMLPALCTSALHMVQVMVTGNMPPRIAALLAFIDIPSIVFLVALVVLGLLNVRRPQAHKRYMAATVFLAMPPSLGRFYDRVFGDEVSFIAALHMSFVTVHLVLVCLIVSDWRNGQRWLLAYPLSLAYFLAVHALMFPVSGTGAWRSFLEWFGRFPV